MRVVLDEDALDLDVASVGEAIAAGALLAESRCRMVIDVYVDGSRWSEEKLASGRNDAQGATEVRLVSADPARLVEDVFADAAEALLEADSQQKKAGDLIQQGSSAAALEALGEAIDIWLSVQKAVVLGTQVMEVSLEDAVVEGTPIREIIERLDERLRAMRSSLESGDVVALADTLMYELPEVVEQWRQMLRHLRDCQRDSRKGGA